MKVYEKFSEQGLFETMSSKGLAIGFMTVIQPRNMDIIYTSTHGSRTLSVFAENNTVEVIAEIVHEMFSDKWNKLFEIAKAELPIDFDYTETITEKIEGEGTNDVDFTSTDTGLVNAYNDDTFVDDTKQMVSNTNKGSNTNKKNRELKKNVLKGSKTELLEDTKNYLKNNYFCDIILADINEFLTLSIFE